MGACSIHTGLEEPTVHALQDFFSTDYGLMSAAGLVIMLGMGVFFYRFFMRHIREDAAAAERASREVRTA